MAEDTSLDYTISRFQPEHAPGIAECVQRVYGDTYIIHRDLYHPERIIELNQTGRQASIVALDAGGQVVGHYAIERPDLGPIGETGEAMVLPEHRHHHLLDSMRRHIKDEARRLELLGVFGLAVTNHVFSQKPYDHTNGWPCGICLGITPRAFHNMDQELSQRLSCVLYFEYLKPAPSLVRHAPPHHQSMIEQIYAQFGIPVTFGEPAPPAGPGKMETEHSAEMKFGLMRVSRIGQDSVAEIRRQLKDWQARGTEVIYLDLPLAQANTPEVCREAEAMGFYLNGIGPHFAPDGDVLRLQLLTVELDLSLLQLHSELARELLEYIGRERERAAK